jgi:hypothetical protein
MRKIATEERKTEEKEKEIVWPRIENSGDGGGGGRE